MRSNSWLRWVLGCLLLIASGAIGCKNGDREGHVEVTVAAAASLRNVMPSLIEAYQREHPRIRIRAAFGASGDLRKRVADGAPVDAVLFANAEPVDELIASGHVDASSRRVVATNDLVLIAPEGTKRSLRFATLHQLPEGEKLAVGEPAAVPAGQYARQALMTLGQWDALEGKLVYGGDVAQVLAYARRGEVAAAIVYGTEIQGVDEVMLLDRADGSWAPAPEVVVGVVSAGEHAHQASRFLEYVAGPGGQAILAAHGFGAP